MSYCHVVSCKNLAHFLRRRYLHFLGAQNSRKIKNKILSRFFVSFERAVVSGCTVVCYRDILESVQFLVKQN